MKCIKVRDGRMVIQYYYKFETVVPGDYGKSV